MKIALTIIGGFAVIAVLALLGAWPTMWIVNYLFTPALITSIFGASLLTFWKAFWLNWLCAVLFKSTNTVSSL